LGRNRIPAQVAGDMIDELLSLRILTVSGAPHLRDLLRQGAASISVPIEVVEANDAGAARDAIAQGLDLIYIDGALGREQRAAVLRAARSARKPPFVILLADRDGAVESFDSDGLAATPAHLDAARHLVERSIRVRMPSRVLVVDDSPTMRSIVRKILAATRLPLNVSEAGEGLAALGLVRNGGFDIIFLDCHMPEFNGFETLAELKREKRRVSVVMMTAIQDDALAERARAQGAAAFLRKPFFPADIEAVMCQFYGLRALNPQRG
jgi:CheY-like chemotaxis protein